MPKRKPKTPQMKESGTESDIFEKQNLPSESSQGMLSVDLDLENVNTSEVQLQSPVESHFALTPVLPNKSNSPANGFTSIDCSTILRQELDLLEKQHSESLKSDGKVDCINNILSPLEENISMFSQLVEEEKAKNEETSDDPSNVEPSKKDELNAEVR